MNNLPAILLFLEEQHLLIALDRAEFRLTDMAQAIVKEAIAKRPEVAAAYSEMIRCGMTAPTARLAVLLDAALMAYVRSVPVEGDGLQKAVYALDGSEMEDGDGR